MEGLVSDVIFVQSITSSFASASLHEREQLPCAPQQRDVRRYSYQIHPRRVRSKSLAFKRDRVEPGLRRVDGMRWGVGGRVERMIQAAGRSSIVLYGLMSGWVGQPFPSIRPHHVLGWTQGDNPVNCSSNQFSEGERYCVRHLD